MAKSLHEFMWLILIILYVLQSTLATKLSSSSQSLISHDDECSMLFQFKENMSTAEDASFDHHAYPKVASWKLNMSDCCLWDGVECSGNSSGHVIGLDLSSSFLSGQINSNSTLFTLIHLRKLNLADNDFKYSQIPSGIGRLLQLSNLNLSYSLFSGQVPKEISLLSQLISLDLSYNPLNLKGYGFRNLVQNLADRLRELFLSKVEIDSEVPDILANFHSLTALVLRQCHLRGEFPTGIFHLPMLQLLDVNGNRDLFGYIPTLHGKSQLTQLILAETNFHGNVPASLGNLRHLNRLDLGSCNFSGHLPGSVSNLTQLTFLKLGDNRFRGRIPSLAGLSKLSYLNLSLNKFDGGNLSDWLGKLPNLLYLDLRVNNLSCEISPSIGNQTYLRVLYLGHNNMIGPVPSSLKNLTHLTNLILGYNKFSGPLPSFESLLNLKELFLSSNNFDKWKLPDWLGKLNKLTCLQLIDVNLYGEIPSSIFNLTQVEEIMLSSNQIGGPIPPFPNTMKKLTSLDLAANQLKGPIPSSLDLQNLEAIWLNDNNINGTVEVDTFLALKKLKVLSLGGNRITLSVSNNHTNDPLPKFQILRLQSCNLKVFPYFLKFQNQLQELYLDGNKIGGLIPEWMKNAGNETLRVLTLSQNSLKGFEKNWSVLPWVNLTVLDLSHNMLHGSIPVSSQTTKNFLVSNNKLSGKFPPSICEFPSLQLLDFSFNNISGSLPSCLEKLNNSLLVLNLRGNILQGTIPNVFTNGSKLQMIDLSDNQLEGQLPRSLGNCVSLQILDLGNNRMDDIFPFWLGALSELQVLILRFNKFHGQLRVPSKTDSKFPKLRIIDLSFNSFSGDLPHQYFQEWSAMKKKKEKDATYMQSNVDIVGTHYFWLGNYSYSMIMTNKGVKLEYEKILNIFMAVDLSSNMFRGTIPESIKFLNGIQLLNLSNNELSGVIPSCMGNLTYLESLDLSSNKLSGKLPHDLVRLNFLAFLNVSNNKLTGPIPRGGQFNTFQNISFLGNSALCGDPLSMNFGVSKVSNPLAVSSDEATGSDFPSGVDWVVIHSGVVSGLVIGMLFGNHLTRRSYKWFLKRFKKCRIKTVYYELPGVSRCTGGADQ